ncbi:hypothetical protein O9992_21375 [Vibrio lentus]|nr:hypothetical protein [Vibrio lentus]
MITNGVTRWVNLTCLHLAHEYTAGFDATQPEYSTWTQKERDQKAKVYWVESSGYDAANPRFQAALHTSESNKSIAVAIASMLKGKFRRCRPGNAIISPFGIIAVVNSTQ